MKRILSTVAKLLALTSLLHFIVSCTSEAPHSGLFPFSTMEKPPSQRSATRRSLDYDTTPQRMTEVLRYHANLSTSDPSLQHAIDQIQVGDVIAFYMNHEEARSHLKRGAIQKIPYELCRYGHLALVVPDPKLALSQQTKHDAKLLQVAMRQAITASDGLDYLRGKSWIVFRPPVGSVDPHRLQTFSQTVIVRGSSAKKAYHYTAALGFWNGQFHPTELEQIAGQYTCTTLIIAALNYSGYQLHCVHRYGILDVVTPRQVTDSWGYHNTRR